MSTFKEKKEMLTNNGIEEIDLDDFVHRVKAQEATAINNMGIDSQLSFLFKHGYSVEDIDSASEKTINL